MKLIPIAFRNLRVTSDSLAVPDQSGLFHATLEMEFQVHLDPPIRLYEGNVNLSPIFNRMIGTDLADVGMENRRLKKHPYIGKKFTSIKGGIADWLKTCKYVDFREDGKLYLSAGDRTCFDGTPGCGDWYADDEVKVFTTE